MRLDPLLAFYALPMFVIWFVYIGLRRRHETSSTMVMDAAKAAGLLEPASLHPKINQAKCMGCGACVWACPEGGILGLIDGKAVLIEPTQCIGHGACKTSCPNDAIALVFGTETRGVEIPQVGPDFQTNIPGIFVAGELGGMGLIRNAIEQGCQAVDSVRRVASSGQTDELDVVIVGAGPAGFAASLAAIQHRLRFVTIEQESFGGTVAHYPRGKLVMTAPATLPLIGKVNFREVSKEKLLEFWRDAAQRTNLKIQYRECVLSVVRNARQFEVVTTHRKYRTRTVLLAIGRRGTPRKLNVPGEDHPKVVYRLIDPEQYRGRHVLVVGGGDSALEAAASIAEQQDTVVTLSYRGANFGRAKLKNRKRVDAVFQSGQLSLILGSAVKSIHDHSVEIEHLGRRKVLKNDSLIVCAGGVLPSQFLKDIGVDMEIKYGTA